MALVSKPGHAPGALHGVVPCAGLRRLPQRWCRWRPPWLSLRCQRCGVGADRAAVTSTGMAYRVGWPARGALAAVDRKCDPLPGPVGLLVATAARRFPALADRALPLHPVEGRRHYRPAA